MALAKLAGRIQQTLREAPKKSLPVRMWIAGGAAVHCYVGTRFSRDVDAAFSRRIVLPEDLAVSYLDVDGQSRVLYLDTQYSDTFAPMHEDAHEDAVPLALPGIDGKLLDVRLLRPVDLAVSKLGRFSDVDRADIQALAREGLISARALRARADSALLDFVGDTGRLKNTIDIACRLVDDTTA